MLSTQLRVGCLKYLQFTHLQCLNRTFSSCLRRSCLKHSEEISVNLCNRSLIASVSLPTTVCRCQTVCINYSKRNISPSWLTRRDYVTSSCDENSGGCGSQSPLNDLEYHQTADETLESLTDFFEDLGDAGYFSSDFDVEFASGVLTVKLGGENGTYVINKQSPNKQIWLSSPKSGPKRYDFAAETGCWVYLHDGVAMHDLLRSEISSVLGQDIDFTNCAFGKPS